MIGESYTVTISVDHSRLASTVGSGELEVLATPAMIAAMEQAASVLLSKFLEQGKTSVGTALQIEHLAATPLGMDFMATATITAAQGKRVEFSVCASDAGGEIGRGTHTRVIVDAARFQQKANAKCETENSDQAMHSDEAGQKPHTQIKRVSTI